MENSLAGIKHFGNEKHKLAKAFHKHNLCQALTTEVEGAGVNTILREKQADLPPAILNVGLESGEVFIVHHSHACSIIMAARSDLRKMVKTGQYTDHHFPFSLIGDRRYSIFRCASIS